MNVTLREAVLSDAEEIAFLNTYVLGYPTSKEDTEKYLSCLLTNDIHKIIVAVSADRVVGYVHACDYELLYHPKLKNIMGIAVSSEYRRRGIGKLLLEAIEAWAKQTGAHGVRLVSGSTRTEAHEFYRRCGYSGDRTQLNFKKEFYKYN